MDGELLSRATSRLAIAWLVLSPVLFRHGGLLRKNWLPLLGTGFLGNGVPAFLFATAQSRIDSSLSGMLNSLTPLMTLLAGVEVDGLIGQHRPNGCHQKSRVVRSRTYSVFQRAGCKSNFEQLAVKAGNVGLG